MTKPILKGVRTGGGTQLVESSFNVMSRHISFQNDVTTRKVQGIESSKPLSKILNDSLVLSTSKLGHTPHSRILG
jgi:hypothetical protein